MISIIGPGYILLICIKSNCIILVRQTQTNISDMLKFLLSFVYNICGSLQHFTLAMITMFSCYSIVGLFHL